MPSENPLKNYYERRAQRYESIRNFALKESKHQVDAFYVYDLDSIRERVAIWRHLMPRVEIFFAAKALFSRDVYTKCIQEGIGFDTASLQEMKEIIAEGVDPNKCIYANAVK